MTFEEYFNFIAGYDFPTIATLIPTIDSVIPTIENTIPTMETVFPFFDFTS